MSKLIEPASSFDFFVTLSKVFGVSFKPSAKQKSSDEQFKVGSVVLDIIQQKLFVVADKGLAVGANRALSHQGAGYWLEQPELSVVLIPHPGSSATLWVSIKSEADEIVDVLTVYSGYIEY